MTPLVRTRCFLLDGSGCTVTETAPEGRAQYSVLMLHDLLADRCGAGRALVRAAASMAENSAVVWRYDQRGAGDDPSEGAWLSVDCWEHWCADAKLMRARLAAVGASPTLVWVACGISAVVALEAAAAFQEDLLVLLDADLLEGVTYDIGRCVPIKGGRFHFGEPMLRAREALRPRERLLGRKNALLMTSDQGSTAAALGRELAGAGYRHVVLDGDLGPGLVRAVKSAASGARNSS